MMMMWLAAFIVAGAFSPPQDLQMTILVVVAALLCCLSSLSTGAGSGRRFLPLCATALVLWMSAGVEREILDTGHLHTRAEIPASNGVVKRLNGDARRVKIDAKEERTEPRHLIDNASIRKMLLDSLNDKRLSRRSAQLIGAIVLAERRGLSPVVRDAYEYLGIAHFLALSGLHLGIIALPIAKLLSISGLPKGIRDAILFSALFFYAFVAGFPPSLLRALCLYASFMVHRALGVRVDLLRCLVIGGIALVVIDFRLMLSAGFQLSFLAVCGIALIGAPLTACVRSLLPGGVPGRIAGFFAAPIVITCSVQLFTLTIVLSLFNRSSLMAPLMNIVVALPLTFLLYLGIAFLVIPVHPLRALLSFPINRLADFLWSVPLHFAKRPHPAVYAGDVHPWLYIIGISLCAISLNRRTRRRSLPLAAAALSLAASFAAGPAGCVFPESGQPRFTEASCDSCVCRLREGCTMIRWGDGILYVSDDLSRKEAHQLTRKLWSAGSRRIESLIIGIGTPGRGKGLVYILERMGVGEIICSPYIASARPDIARSAGWLKVPIRVSSKGDILKTGTYSIEVLGPEFPPPVGKAISPMEAALRCRVTADQRITSQPGRVELHP
jgi:ComEC/Rec2-related protein